MNISSTFGLPAARLNKNLENPARYQELEADNGDIFSPGYRERVDADIAVLNQEKKEIQEVYQLAHKRAGKGLNLMIAGSGLVIASALLRSFGVLSGTMSSIAGVSSLALTGLGAISYGANSFTKIDAQTALDYNSIGRNILGSQSLNSLLVEINSKTTRP